MDTNTIRREDLAHELVGMSEIAEMLGWSRQRVGVYSYGVAGMPHPVATLRMGRVWLRSEIEAWARGRGWEVREA
jgi:predicted DNA-binding transcriptional regulator AlpA